LGGKREISRCLTGPRARVKVKPLFAIIRRYEMKLLGLAKFGKIVLALGGVAAWTAVTVGTMFWAAKKLTKPQQDRHTKPPPDKEKRDE
jgi:hypothetical protein